MEEMNRSGVKRPGRLAYAGGRSTVIALSLGLSSLPHAAMADQIDKLLHSWAWNEKNLPRETLATERVFHTFTFKRDHTVESSSVMLDGIGPGMGEALSDTGHFRLAGSSLLITGTNEPGLWPTDVHGSKVRYSCRISFTTDGSSFRLSRCPIAGEWIRSDVKASK